MRKTVKEDIEAAAREFLPARARYGTLSILVVLAAAICAAPIASAQDAAANKPFGVRIVDVSSQTSSVTIPLNRSVIIETSVKVERADVVATNIVDAQAISATELLLTGQAYGRTNVVLWGEEGQQYVLEVAVELDLDQLSEALGAIDPFGSVKVRSVFGNILLTGTVTSAERAGRMVEVAGLFLPPGERGRPTTVVQNHLEVAGERQVMLQVVVAEVNRSAARELGVNGFLAGENVADMFLINQIGGINPIDISAVEGVPITEAIPFQTGEMTSTASPTISLGFPRIQMQQFIRALADNSLVTVLAEPNLVAISGETASFLAGGEFPVPVPQGLQQVTIQFREFGVRLNFTPVVLGNGIIRLRVAPEVSELDFSSATVVQGLAVPGLSTRSAETTVEIGSGQTFVIAGLLSEQVRGLVSRVPGIGEIPVLGALFRSVSFRRSQTELVILVTPELVAPLDPHQKFSLPGQDRGPLPSDFELYALGLLEGPEDVEAESGCSAVSAHSGLGSEPEELSIHGPFGHERGLGMQ